MIEGVAIPALNEVLGIIGETPLDRRRLKQQSYGKRKFEQLQAGVQETFQIDKSRDDSEEMISQLKEKFKSATRGEKIQILTIMPRSWSVRKLESEFKVSNWMARTAKRLQTEVGVMASPNAKPGRKLSDDIVKTINDYYLSDSVSCEMPGMKDCVSVYSKTEGKKVQVQKHLVLCNLKEAYQNFRSTFPTVNVGFSKFAELRPKQCVLAGAAGTHSVCVCTIHQNVKLMLKAIEDHVKYEYHHLLASMACNPGQPRCFLGECEFCPGRDTIKQTLNQQLEEKGIDIIIYKQWTSTDRCDLITVQNDIDDFCDILCCKLESLGPHDFIAKQQSQFLRSLKNDLEEGQVIVLSDFSENYSFVIQDAAQGYYWANPQATIHPCVVYYKEKNKIESVSYVMVSDCLVHDTVAVSYFLNRLISLIKTKLEPTKIFYFSDGAAAQYKNRKNFANLAYHTEDYDIPAEWHFFATSHGKGPCDGIGGTLKRLATRASLQRPVDLQIQTPIQLYEWAKENLSGITTIFCKADDITKHGQKIKARLENSLTVAGTQKLHAFHHIPGEHKLLVKRFSNSDESRKVKAVKP